MQKNSTNLCLTVSLITTDLLLCSFDLAGVKVLIRKESGWGGYGMWPGWGGDQRVWSKERKREV